MKQFIKLTVLMLIGLALNGCYNAQEKEAIEKCKRNCKYPLTFEVIETSSTSHPAKIDTTTIGVCYIRYSKSVTNSFKIYRKFGVWDFNYKDFHFDYGRPCRIDSIHTYTVRRYCPRYTFFKVTYSCKNGFGVPCQDSRYFDIIGNYISDYNNPYDRDYDDFIETRNTISTNHFINNSPGKIFKDEYEIKEYLCDFKSNFKLKTENHE